MTPRQILSHAIEEAVTFGDIPAPLEPAVMTAASMLPDSVLDCFLRQYRLSERR
jgi:hypothetical protein